MFTALATINALTIAMQLFLTAPLIARWGLSRDATTSVEFR
jgi:hypothetical protein